MLAHGTRDGDDGDDDAFPGYCFRCYRPLDSHERTAVMMMLTTWCLFPSVLFFFLTHQLCPCFFFFYWFGPLDPKKKKGTAVMVMTIMIMMMLTSCLVCIGSADTLSIWPFFLVSDT